MGKSGDFILEVLDEGQSATSFEKTALVTYRSGEGGTPLYKPYGYVWPPSVWLLSRFAVKMVILTILV